MATRKATMRWASLEAGDATTKANEVKVKLTITGATFARTEFSGELNQHMLFGLAKQCLAGLNTIHARQVSEAEFTATLIKRLRGGDL